MRRQEDQQLQSCRATVKKRCRRNRGSAQWQHAARVSTAVLALSALASLPAAQASREMLLNQPLPGDALVLAQPSYEWGRRGPAKLRAIHRYAKQRVDNRILAAGGKNAESEGGVGGSGLSWDQVAALPPEEPFPMGRSEQRLINYGTLIYHRMTTPVRQPTNAGKEPAEEHKPHAQPGHREESSEGEANAAAAEHTEPVEAVANDAEAEAKGQPQEEESSRKTGRSARRAQQAKARLEGLSA